MDRFLLIFWPLVFLVASFIAWRQKKRLHPELKFNFGSVDFISAIFGAIPILLGVIYCWEPYGLESAWQCALLYLPAILYLKIDSYKSPKLRLLARMRLHYGITRRRPKVLKIIECICTGTFIFLMWRFFAYYQGFLSMMGPFTIIIPLTLPFLCIFSWQKWKRLKLARMLAMESDKADAGHNDATSQNMSLPRPFLVSRWFSSIIAYTSTLPLVLIFINIIHLSITHHWLGWAEIVREWGPNTAMMMVVIFIGQRKLHPPQRTAQHYKPSEAFRLYLHRKDYPCSPRYGYFLKGMAVFDAVCAMALTILAVETPASSIWAPGVEAWAAWGMIVWLWLNVPLAFLVGDELIRLPDKLKAIENAQKKPPEQAQPNTKKEPHAKDAEPDKKPEGQ